MPISFNSQEKNLIILILLLWNSFNSSKGTSGAQWTPEEVDSTRQRILLMITPGTTKMTEKMGIRKMGSGLNFHTTESMLMRLAFHDCIPYADGSGGCDGCLNWTGMVGNINETPEDANPKDERTSNKRLERLTQNLEKIYKSIDWPFAAPLNSTTVSLYQSGKSRADLWQFAGLVALEQAIERANRACDLDYHQRQQVSTK